MHSANTPTGLIAQEKAQQSRKKDKKKRQELLEVHRQNTQSNG